nr:hypothetical protein [Kibdelosporangium sp. MJ126-NF4]CEL15143.1 hypothetical protein [Kibdelosporangium sp. MJ126-NF4]CTQ93261.1 hypothetical protein [Kibdelosporangium sp. MJ126-NF4]
MHNGISVDSWALVEDDCTIKVDIAGDQAQFRFGGRNSGLDIVFTEQGLANLVEQSTEALKQLREQ